ncbi:MAG: sigma factor, partial [Ilumatobacteraceae bacterium]
MNSSDAVVGGVTGREPGGRGAEEDALFVEVRRTGSRRLRNELVERHMGLAAHVARRFGRRGPSDDDLRQVAFLALVKAVDR